MQGSMTVCFYILAEPLRFPKFVMVSAGLGKSRAYVRYVLEIINFTSCPTSLFSNKYVHEHNFSVL